MSDVLVRFKAMVQSEVTGWGLGLGSGFRLLKINSQYDTQKGQMCNPVCV